MSIVHYNTLVEYIACALIRAHVCKYIQYTVECALRIERSRVIIGTRLETTPHHCLSLETAGSTSIYLGDYHDHTFYLFCLSVFFFF